LFGWYVERDGYHRWGFSIRGSGRGTRRRWSP
jgi:hypothetical protein